MVDQRVHRTGWVLAVALLLSVQWLGCSGATNPGTPGTDGGPMDALAIDVRTDVPVSDVLTHCATNADCNGNPAGTQCDTTTGMCVGCMSSPDTCPAAQHCDPVPQTCAAGCSSDAACMGNTGADGGIGLAFCDLAMHACVECVMDGQCPSGLVCRGDVCVPGCSSTHTCPTGSACCTGACVNVTSNIADCGMCGATCTAANGVPACQAGVCAVGSCTPPYADCDTNPANGCEANTQISPTNCGACGMACPIVPNATASCTGGACGFTCNPGYTDCNRIASDGCEVNTAADTLNCGICGSVCAPAEATGSCIAGACIIGMCNAGYADCDHMVGNGCEVNTQTSAANCNGCGMVCPAEAHALGACAMGACSVTCNPGYGDCDMNPATGCEVQLVADPNHCGSCGNVCMVPNAAAGCMAGACTVGTCTAGYADCDGLVANGCESNLATSATACGMCGATCLPGPEATATCSSGTCTRGCNAGFADCDGVLANGCEVNVVLNPANCGSCGNTCAASSVCSGGACQSSCVGGTVLCAGACVNESTDVNDCGGCGIVCPAGFACITGSCARAAPGEQDYTTAGSYSFTVPPAVFSVSVVVVGGGGSGSAGSANVGGGGGGALCYANSIAVTPGQVIPVVVGVAGSSGTAGGASSFNGSLDAGGGAGTTAAGGGAGGAGTGGTCFSGGIGGSFYGGGAPYHAGAGGAAGYAGNGGRGSDATGSGCGNNAAAGTGGGGGGGGGGSDPANCGFGYGAGGGGVGLSVQGANGAAGGSDCSCGYWGNPGGGGSGGGNATGTGGTSGSGGGGGAYGGGGGSGPGGGGAVRIIWGVGRTFPASST